MKILWLAHDGNMSGANACLVEFLQLMQEAGHENHLIVPRDGKIIQSASPFTKSISTIKFYSWNWPVGSQPPLELKVRRVLRNKKAVNDISRLVAKIQPDFVVTNTVVTPVAALAAKKMGKKHIWFVHEFGEEDHGYIIGGGFQKAAAIINRLSYKVAFISEAVRSKYAAVVPANKQAMVYNALLRPPVLSSLKPAPAIKLVMLGQIAPAKNQLDAIKGINICIKNGLHVSLNIIGKADEPDYLKVLEDFIATENLRDHVRFVGTTTQPEVLLAKHDLLLMCSRSEAFGRVTVEALKCGVPVIAADSGGTVEIIQDGENGFLYKSGDATDMARKIDAYANNKSFFNRQNIAKAANEKYNAQKSSSQLTALFQ